MQGNRRKGVSPFNGRRASRLRGDMRGSHRPPHIKITISSYATRQRRGRAASGALPVRCRSPKGCPKPCCACRFFPRTRAPSSRFSACAAGFCVSFGGVHFARSPKLCEISKSESRNFFHYCDFSINTAIIPAPRRPYFCGIAILCGFADWEDASFQINSLFATSVLFICPYLFTPRFFIIAAQKIHLIET